MSILKILTSLWSDSIPRMHSLRNTSKKPLMKKERMQASSTAPSNELWLKARVNKLIKITLKEYSNGNKLIAKKGHPKLSCLL